MSLFKDFKDDLSQAVNELLPEGGSEDSYNDDEMVNTLEEVQNVETEVEKEDEEESFNDDVDQEFLKELFNEEYDSEDDSLSDETLTETLSREENEVPEEITFEETLNDPEDKENKVKNEVTVITKGTIIEGSITSDGSLEVMGTIHGDIDCLGKLSIIGEVTGNAMASEVYVNTKRLEGSINSEGSVKISDGTVVIGDITASSGVIAGAVKGEIDINGPIVVDSKAIIKGNINAKSVQINNGAIIDGFCSLSYSDVDIESVFDK
ncbi:polymer-forming protein [Mobilisporobacter senegalensis]|uniref:Polymer-forming protein n=1 Tax=Mobilisporobacter senegalensis TaxID=1329262 RepID=A0A3N1XX66_9FIRM|nr:polymer-forming cytoskeletal protein [Mobilisporobacter senegalensis]ROR30801.1 polymer-forming protein [Mobilisporobacter senegalensis]